MKQPIRAPLTNPRLLAHFLLRQSSDGACIARMSIAAGDYVTEARLVGDDIEIKMFERSNSG